MPSSREAVDAFHDSCGSTFAMLSSHGSELQVDCLYLSVVRHCNFTGNVHSASVVLHRTFHSSRSREALVKDTFQRYPSWLAGWRVTFGCLRADLVRNKSREEQEIAIKDALFGVTLLSFGQGKPSKRHQRRHCQIEYNYMLPIVGGFMTMTSPEDSCGALSFSLISTCRDDNESFVLETSVSGYRPKFAGPAPVSRLRAGIYRSTQSMVHAYVMWRFHHYCYHQTS